MNSNSRTHNTFVNAFVNVALQILIFVINFSSRKIFIVAFGENYLGINGLFSNILSVLSMAELGIGSAIVYCLYKPIAEKDYKKISALINYYKKLYGIIGLIVAGFGVSVVPFLKYLVNINADIGNVSLYYLLYLLNTVSTYYLVYRTSILIADQKNYVIKICNVVMVVVQFIVLTIVALVFKNFLIYLACQIFFSISLNFTTSRIATKMYPFITDKVQIEAEEKNQIWTNIKSMFSYQLGSVIVNNTSNILISVLISTVVVGFYSNYSMVIAAVSTFITLIFTSAQASIGNLAATEGQEKQYGVFQKISFLSFWITLFCSVSFAVLFQDFITIMYTEHYLLNYKVVLACISNFYMVNILYPIYCYRNTVGLFRETKNIMIYTSIVNVVLSVILGKLLGLFGIFIATVFARLFTNFWFEPIKLYKLYFNKSVKEYFIRQLAQFLLTAVIIAVMLIISYMLKDINIYIRFALKVLLCALVPNLILIAIFRKNKQYLDLKKMVLSKIIRK